MTQETAPADISRREEFLPPSLEDQPNATILILDVPTPGERDRIGTRLFELGVVAVTRDHLRATIIDDLYDLHDEAKADELASFLDGYWLRLEAHSTAREGWKRRESQRRYELMLGLTDRPADPLPPSVVTPREQAKATLLVNDVTARSARLRALSVAMQNYPHEVERATARLAIKGVMPGPGSAEPFALELEGDHEKLTQDSLDRLRLHIGERAWDELLGRVAVLFAPIEASAASEMPAENNEANGNTSAAAPVKPNRAKPGVPRRKPGAAVVH